MILKIRIPSDREKVLKYVSKLPDKQYDVTVNLHRNKRSCPQNRLYWMWLGVISKETGNESNDLHEFFSMKWLPIVEKDILGITIFSKPISTTSLNTLQFKEYLDKIQAFASCELGIVLPDPEDLYFEELVDWYSNHF